MKNLFNVSAISGPDENSPFLVRKANCTDKERFYQLQNFLGNGVTPGMGAGKKVLPIFILMTVFAVAGCALAVTVSILTDGRSLTQMSALEIALSVVALCALLAPVGLSFLAKFIVGRYNSRPEMVNLSEEKKELSAKILRDLGIPADSPQLDVLCHTFTVKNGVVIYDKSKKARANLPFYLFKENENLCFGCHAGVYAFPLHSVRTVVKKNINYIFTEWNKKEKARSKTLRGAVKSHDNDSWYSAKCFSVQLCRNGEDWEVLIPAYEWEIFTQVSDLTAAG